MCIYGGTSISSNSKELEFYSVHKDLRVTKVLLQNST